MTHAKIDAPAARKTLRLWPGVLAVILLWLARFGLPAVAPELAGFAVLGGLAGGVLVLAWWLFLSRAPWSERLGSVASMVAALVVTARLVHPSIANGMMGMMLPITAVPVLSLALVGWAIVGRRSRGRLRRAAQVSFVLLACGAFTLLRTEGITGDGLSDLRWRWTETAEERLLARAGEEPAPSTSPLPPEPSAVGPEVAWTGFRGPERDGVVRAVRIDPDWAKSPPVELWRRPIGPGWSSFAVDGDLVYTQEQRGDDEVVACYHLTSGEPVWMHRDAARFWESNAGAGPRGTPELGDGRVHTLGATGILNALDARTGSVAWSRNAAADTGAELPGWGFTGSPLLVGDVILVATSGVLAAYDRATGEQRWIGPSGGGSYSSPHRATIGGVRQVLFLGGGGARAVLPADGTLLWEHSWPGTPIVQPAVIAGGDVLISTAGDLGALGLRRITVTNGPGGWSVEERWTSRGLKPYFNDFVVHEGHAYGFDGSILACLDLADGRRAWKGGRYGNGQLVLLSEQGLLLVLSEEGELALVSARPDEFTELARFPALEGKTWNHPVLVGDVLLVRNGEEMAAFRLPEAGP